MRGTQETLQQHARSDYRFPSVAALEGDPQQTLAACGLQVHHGGDNMLVPGRDKYFTTGSSCSMTITDLNIAIRTNACGTAFGLYGLLPKTLKLHVMLEPRHFRRSTSASFYRPGQQCAPCCSKQAWIARDHLPRQQHPAHEQRLQTTHFIAQGHETETRLGKTIKQGATLSHLARSSLQAEVSADGTQGRLTAMAAAIATASTVSPKSSQLVGIRPAANAAMCPASVVGCCCCCCCCCPCEKGVRRKPAMEVAGEVGRNSRSCRSGRLPWRSLSTRKSPRAARARSVLLRRASAEGEAHGP